MLCRGLESLDKLDTVEEREKAEAKAKALAKAHEERSLLLARNVALSEAPSDFSDPFWATLDFGGRTFLITSGS